MAVNQQPKVYDLYFRNPASAVGVDTELAAVQVPEAGTVTLVEYLVDATLAGADTNSRTWSVEDKTASRQVAVLAMVAAAGSATAFQAKSVPVTNSQVAAGDVLSFKSLHIGTGIVDPGGMVHVQISRNA